MVQGNLQTVISLPEAHLFTGRAILHGRVNNMAAFSRECELDGSCLTLRSLWPEFRTS
jgi:hypothetical protein